MSERRSLAVAVLLLGLAGSTLASNAPVPVSPGDVSKLALIEDRCPSFSWAEVVGADQYEIVAYHVPSGTDLRSINLGAAERVFLTRVPGGVASWTPNLDQCLEPGQSYVWFVRALFLDEEITEIQAGDASDGLIFRVSTRPSSQEVTAAMDLLRRHAEAATLDALAGSERGTPADETGPVHVTESKYEESRAGALTALLSAKTALKAHISDTTGEAYGVIGISDSIDGAGIAAANNSGGADLVLDGSADFAADTFISQSGIDRPSSSDQIFHIRNSAGGGMTLQVDAVDVVTVDTDRDTLRNLSCAVNGVPLWNGLNWTCPEGSLITSITAGSGLIGGGTSGDVTVQIGSGMVTAVHLAENSVGASELAGNSVSSAEILNGSVTSADFDSSIQRRVTGTCSEGSISTIASNGSVTCLADKSLKMEYGTMLIAASYNGGDVEQYWYYPSEGTPLCYLSLVQLRDVDGGSEDAYCYTFHQPANGRWVLRARSEVGDDADAICRATCYRFYY